MVTDTKRLDFLIDSGLTIVREAHNNNLWSAWLYVENGADAQIAKGHGTAREAIDAAAIEWATVEIGKAS